MSAIHRKLLEEVKSQPHPYPSERFSGKGIVICTGGRRYFISAWVCINMLRKLGCELPIEAWHLGDREMSEEMKSLLAELNVQCVDAMKVREKYPVRTLNGWELKPYALIHSRFQEAILLDADNVPVLPPQTLFDTVQYKETGALFWPDYGRLGRDRSIWRICGVEYRNEPEIESGQVVVDKARCWKALQVTMHLNEHSDYYYRHIFGDKETFHMAWRCLDQPYSMPTRGIQGLDGTMCQHDFDGRVMFQHRNMHKWELGNNPRIRGFRYEEECRRFLEELAVKWKAASVGSMSAREKALFDQVTLQRYYRYIRVGYDSRLMEFLDNLEIGEGRASIERVWSVKDADGELRVQIHGDSGTICSLEPGPDGAMHGRWHRHERMPINLVPIADAAATSSQKQQQILR